MSRHTHTFAAYTVIALLLRLTALFYLFWSCLFWESPGSQPGRQEVCLEEGAWLGKVTLALFLAVIITVSDVNWGSGGGGGTKQHPECNR